MSIPNIPNGRLMLTDDDQIDFALAKLTRLARRGYSRNHYVFLTHEAREILDELIREIRKNDDVNNKPDRDKDRDVNNTPVMSISGDCPHGVIIGSLNNH